MVRIPPQVFEKGVSDVADRILARRGARGLTPLDQTLLNAPAVAVRFSALSGTWSNALTAHRTDGIAC